MKPSPRLSDAERTALILSRANSFILTNQLTRDQAIVWARCYGLTAAEIGRYFHLSVAQVRRIWRRVGEEVAA
jgi:DNA-binding CsgD family transcriptional regulator